MIITSTTVQIFVPWKYFRAFSWVWIFRELFLEQQKRSWMEIYWTEKRWRILSIQQIQHILNFMRDDAIMLKCWTVNEYYGKFTSSCGVVAMITFHEFPSEYLKAEQRKVPQFPVIFGTCVNGDSNFLADTDNGVDFNDYPMKTQWHSMSWRQFPFLIDPWCFPIRFRIFEIFHAH